MKIEIKNKAVISRKKGYSINEIARELKVSKSTISLWVRDVLLNSAAQKRIENLKENGRFKSIKTKKGIKDALSKNILQKAKSDFAHLEESKEIYKILCAILYWCEGEKNTCSVRFTNSDPLMISTFLFLIRKGFKLDEKKFRVCLHLHSYHNDFKQINYWSSLTNIPVSQFIKVYKKQNSGKQIRENYPGCASIRYHDFKIAKELALLKELFAKKYGRLG